MRWAYKSGTGVCAELTWQVLIACTDHSPFKTCWAYASGTAALSIRVRKRAFAFAEHTHHELTRTLSIHIMPMLSLSIKIPNFKRPLQNMLIMLVRNWCVHWACASETDACTERMRQELMRTLSMHIRK